MIAALALVVVGGLALINALTSPSPGPAPSGVVSPTAQDADGDDTDEPSEPSDSSATPLVITVTGSPTDVFVKVSGSEGPVLQKGELGTGETRKYDQVPLDVVVEDSGSVEVRIYGELQTDSDGGRGQWVVRPRSS